MMFLESVRAKAQGPIGLGSYPVQLLSIVNVGRYDHFILLSLYNIFIFIYLSLFL